MIAALSPERLETVRSMIEQWHDFFLMTGTAAVTLAGLLFVAVSINVDTLLDSRRAALLDLARQAMLALLMMLIISLIFLLPAWSPRIQAAALVGTCLVPLVFTLRGMRLDATQGEHGLGRGVLLRRRLLSLVAYVGMLVVGLFMWRGQYEIIFFIVGPICLLFGNATGSAWEMMVEVGRLKARDARGA